MTLPSSGLISMGMVSQELSTSATRLNLNDNRVRSLAGRPSGVISMADLRGKSENLKLILINEFTQLPGLLWEPSYNGVGSYNYTCNFYVKIENGTGPYNIVMSVENNQGTSGTPTFVDLGGGRASWTVRVPRFGDSGTVFASATFQAKVWNSNNADKVYIAREFGMATGQNGN